MYKITTEPKSIEARQSLPEKHAYVSIPLANIKYGDFRTQFAATNLHPVQLISQLEDYFRTIEITLTLEEHP